MKSSHISKLYVYIFDYVEFFGLISHLRRPHSPLRSSCNAHEDEKDENGIKEVINFIKGSLDSTSANVSVLNVAILLYAL